MMTSSQPRQYHLAYLTANDGAYYLVDSLHFRHMAERNPGVPHVQITVAISRVRPFTATDRKAISGLIRRASSSPWLSVRAVIWKGNVGRDFSSAEACLASIGDVAADHDFVMVRNRSAYGPLSSSWYQAYIDQYEKFPATGLVGSTINLAGHPRTPSDHDSIHVQTYVYVSQWQHLKLLLSNYPGRTCVDRLDLIVEGEIGLSRLFMDRGLRISCLQWPDHAFDSLSTPDPSLPRHDIKKGVVGVPFRHKHRKYHRDPRAWRHQLAWLFSLMMAGWWHRRPSATAPPGSCVKHLYMDKYG